MKSLRKADKLFQWGCLRFETAFQKWNSNFAFNAPNVYPFSYFVKPENLYGRNFCLYQQMYREAWDTVSLSVLFLPLHLCARWPVEKDNARQVCSICSSFCIVFQQHQLLCFAKVQASVWSQICALLVTVKGHNHRFKLLPGSRNQNSNFA